MREQIEQKGTILAQNLLDRPARMTQQLAADTKVSQDQKNPAQLLTQSTVN